MALTCPFAPRTPELTPPEPSTPPPPPTLTKRTKRRPMMEEEEPEAKLPAADPAAKVTPGARGKTTPAAADPNESRRGAGSADRHVDRLAGHETNLLEKSCHPENRDDLEEGFDDGRRRMKSVEEKEDGERETPQNWKPWQPTPARTPPPFQQLQSTYPSDPHLSEGGAENRKTDSHCQTHDHLWRLP